MIKLFVMKKMILTIAMIAGMSAIANIQTLQAASHFQIETVSQDENGFVEVKLEELNPEVQAAVKALLADYDVKVLKHNVEKQLTKVVLTNKQDQSEKKVLLDEKGNEVSKDPIVKEQAETVEEQEP
jgi:phosphotransferase system IIA component